MTGSVNTIVDCIRIHALTKPERTVFTFLGDGVNESERLSFGSLNSESQLIANALLARGLSGERAALVFRTSSQFLTAFFGCLMANVIAVPMPEPSRRRGAARLLGVLNDCEPALVITSSDLCEDLNANVAESEAHRSVEVLSVEHLLEEGEAVTSSGDVEMSTGPIGSDVAFLQYTSGSTGNPKGVVVTHRNIIANQAMIKDAFEHDSSTVFGGWLPLFHDMGLVGNVFQPIYLGIPCVLMPPIAFVRSPVRWLQMISKYGVTTSGAPNFGFDLCLARVREEDLAEIDLSSWKVAFNGAERVSAETVRRFADRFGKYGFAASTMFPCYGLAEATLFVTGERLPSGPGTLAFDRDRLEEGGLQVLADDESTGRRLLESVACGRTWNGCRIEIIDPSGARAAPNAIGEICVTGSNVAAGYWNRPDDTRATFEPSEEGEDAGRRLHTGDLGFLDEEQRLHVVGRLKELIILNGRNFYPQDIERVSSSSHAVVAGCNAAAFSATDEMGREHLVVVQEINPRAQIPDDTREISRSVSAALVREFGLPVGAVHLAEPGAIPKTSSGKNQRSRCRQMLEIGELQVLEVAG